MAATLQAGLKLSVAQSPIISLRHQSIRKRSHRPTIRGIRSDLDLEKLEEEPSVSDLKSALGMDSEDKTLSSRFSPFQSVVDNNDGAKKGNPFMETMEKASEGLSDFTEGDEYQTGGLQLVLLFLPFWVLYVLVAADFVHLPFRLPFL